MTMQETIELPTEPLLQHWLMLACEHDVYDNTHDGVEWEWPTPSDVDHIEVFTPDSDRRGYSGPDAEYAISIRCKVDGKWQEKTHSATRTNPASYRTHTTEVWVDVVFIPEDMGYFETTVESLNGPTHR